MKPTFALEAEHSDALVSLLTAGWEAHLREGVVAYDPATAVCWDTPPFRYHCVPERQRRPKTDPEVPPPPEGLSRPHVACPFDSEEFVSLRVLAHVARGDRRYMIVCNKFPVTARHFLAIRTPDAPVETLSQRIHGPEELEDFVLLLTLLGAPFRCYFNSNRGVDGSASGSSVNHWHIQFLSYFEGSPSLLTAPPVWQREHGGIRVGTVPNWPAKHVLVEAAATEVGPACALIWKGLEALSASHTAYNLEAAPTGEGRFRLFLFPRRYAPPTSFGPTAALSCDIGGCELGGHFVLPQMEILDWIRAHPEAAHELSYRRLAESTRELVL